MTPLSFGGMAGLPTIVQSKAVYGNNTTITAATVKVNWTGGNLQFYLGLSSDPDTAPTSWEEVTVTTGVDSQHSFTATGTWLWYKILKDNATVIANTTDTYGRVTSPAITIKNITEA